MKNFVFGAYLVGLLSLVGGQVMAAEPMYGVLMVVKGSVKVQAADQKTTDAKVGGRVHQGDTLITAADSRAKVVMSDRNVINVNPDTQVVIAKYENDAASGSKNVELNLLKGKVRNNVEQTYDGEKNKFLIKTPTAVAGVRGTQFLAGFNPTTQMTSVVTFKGSVTFATIGPKGNIIGAPVMVNKGQMTQAAPNTAPEKPKAVPKDEMKKMDGDSTAANKDSSGSKEQKREAASTDGGAKSDKPDGPPPPPPPPPPAPVINPDGPKITPTPPPPPPPPTPTPSLKTKVNVRPVIGP